MAFSSLLGRSYARVSELLAWWCRAWVPPLSEGGPPLPPRVRGRLRAASRGAAHGASRPPRLAQQRALQLPAALLQLNTALAQ